MKRSIPFLTLLITLLTISLLTVSTVAQDAPLNIADFSGKNVYFSEVYQEYSQFDRSPNGISRFAGMFRRNGANLFTLEWRKGIPADADLVVITAPIKDMAADNAARLWAYLQTGGHVLLIVDPLDRTGAQNKALGARGLFELTWADLGLRARPDMIVTEGEMRHIDVTETDPKTGATSFTFSGDKPILKNKFFTQRVNQRHPITASLVPLLKGLTPEDETNLNALYFSAARSLEVDASPQDYIITPLIYTDDAEFYGESEYGRYLLNGYVDYNIGLDSQRGDLVLAAAYENPRNDARMVLLGDDSLVLNGAGFETSPNYSSSFVYPANVQLMMNVAAWLLSTDPVVMALPSPAPTSTATITPTPTPTPTATPSS